MESPQSNDEPLRGDEFDYDFDIKRKWRGLWKAFLEANTPVKERPHMKIVCLPGRQCLEIPLYLELGFQPENIVGVEGGRQAAREEFRQNAARLGIQGYEGDIGKFLSGPTRFDVVSLDFPGYFSKKQDRILNQVLLNRKAWFLLNQYATRENPSTQCMFKFMHGTTLHADDDDEIEDWNVRHQLLNDVFTGNIDMPLSDARNDISTDLALVVLGDERKENFACPLAEDIFELGRDEMRVNQAIFEIRDELSAIFNRHADQQLAQHYSKMLKWGCYKAAFGASLGTKIEQYSYRNPNNSPFNSAFVELNLPLAEYQSTIETLELILKSARHRLDWIMNNSRGKTKGAFVFKRNGAVAIDSGKQLKTSDRLCFVSKSKNIASISAGQLLKDIRTLEQVYDLQFYKDELQKRAPVE